MSVQHRRRHKLSLPLRGSGGAAHAGAASARFPYFSRKNRENGAWLRGLVVLSVLGSSALALAASPHSPYENLAIFARALTHIETSYVVEPDRTALIYGAIRGMVRTLDPHSDYLTPDEYRLLMSDTRGRFGGVGVEIDVQDGWLTVTAVFPNSPAARADLRVGDRFVYIDGVRARDMAIEEAVRRMRGEPGTMVQVSLRRGENEPSVEVALRREIIRIDAVEGRLLADGHLYVRLRVFQETAARELHDVLDEATERMAKHGGVQGILLDLRDNPGGLLDQAVLVADEFLADGVVVSTRGRGGRQLATASARRAGTLPDIPLVVLVNGFTASAAEIVAAALQDHQRALLVGTRTFGKGSVQNVIDLPDGSALKLTIARYYSPRERAIQAQGIEPDVYIAALRTQPSTPAVTLSEATLEGHLEREGQAEATPTVAREQRHGPEARDQPAVFADDFQAQMAYQTLRAVAFDRARRPPQPR